MTQFDRFALRHLGPNDEDVKEMLQAIQTESLDQLISETIPDGIRLKEPLNLGEPLSEYQFLQQIRAIASKNKQWKTYIGLGYYGTVTPPAIQRNIFENPGWYTQYTPYQAEIAQGRLEALLNFQTMVSDLTGMELANASLLDEGTAAAEAMLMAYRIKNKRAKASDAANVVFVDEGCLQTTIEVVKTRAEPLRVEVVVADFKTYEFHDKVFACLLQYPTQNGAVCDYAAIVGKAKAVDAMVLVAADLLSLCLLSPPGEWGADVVVGNTQRFGVPMGYGGPHAAYFATKEEHARQLPGRIIGVSVDNNGNPAYRMALQTREQHIKRDKATSNICTAQALLAIMAGMYAVYHGEYGLKSIAGKIHQLTCLLDAKLQQLGYKQLNEYYFDTLLIDLRNHPSTSGLRVRRVTELEEINFHYLDESGDLIGISLDETCSMEDVQRIVRVFAEANDIAFSENGQKYDTTSSKIPDTLQRQSAFLTHPIFKMHQSESKLMRYIKSLENKDLSLTHSMIPLGSCTMKLNAAVQLMPVSFPEFSQLHPFVPIDQAAGYQQIFEELERDLSIITGFAACSLQPNSGAQGEYAGLMVIRAYHQDRGEAHRNIALIPSSAHGTNPASAVMAGMEVVIVKCDVNGNIDVADLKAKAEKYNENLSALLVTYPSTHGVFETAIQEICKTIHEHGGQVYMDGANMNAQVGLTNPAMIGADVCHLNLHKTFSIPHGGGGPGMGPICVAGHLKEFLPAHPFKPKSAAKGISAIASAPWSSASILLISYAYIKLLGMEGVVQATKYAILNANYIKQRLAKYYDVLYVGEQGRVAHELILDMRPFKRTHGIEVDDIAKRLMDYGFHAPTISFPVVGTMMIEPTESEAKEELDRFCEAMIAIRQEMEEVVLGTADENDNVLKNAPHTLQELTANDWSHPYSRQKAAYPLPYLHQHKFWVKTARISNSYGDRNLVCSCPPIEVYETQETIL
ncbi:MAG: aminomethyl-transferring glycine dehydrogenase [Chitinophagales bacterium]